MQQEGLLSGEEEHKEKSINLHTYIGGFSNGEYFPPPSSIARQIVYE